MRTTIIGIVAGLAVSVAPVCKAGLVLNAPGVPVGTQSATKVPFTNNYVIAQSYKFVFAGIEAKSNTGGAPGSSGTQGNGGQFHVSATVSVPTIGKLKVGKIEFRDIQDFNTSPLKQILISPAEVFRATTTPITINVEWKGEGNAHKPDGIFNILGEHQKHPPAPTGSLNFAVGQWMLQGSGATQNPDAQVKIVRE